MKEYTRIEYIESDGNQWIDTGFVPNNESRVVLDAKVNTATENVALFGARKDITEKCFAIWISAGNKVNPQFGNVSYNTNTVSIDYTKRIFYDMNKNQTTIGGNTVSFTNSNFSTGYNLYLFALNNGGTKDERVATGKLYSCRIYDNETLVRDYIPIKNSEGICGLYDQVEKKFYASQGSSAFIGGEEIEDSPLSSPYGFRRRLMNEAYLTKITTIRINQNLTDPSAMITRIVDGGGIEAIRANSHRYVGVFDSSTELMSLRQLDDNDGTKYLDGTTAPITTLGNDVWMKLPQFFYKAEEYETDIWDISFAYGNKPDDTFKEWDGKDLIGVYKACSSSSYMYSTSGKAAAALSYSNAVSYARNRGTGFSGMRWRYHCMFSFLFWAYYGTTYSTNVCGVASSSTKLTTGVNNSLGMNDTSSGTNVRVNFWGMEDYWGNMREYVIDTSASYSNKKFTVSNLDGTTSTCTDPSPSQYIVNKITITENLEFYPKTKSSTRTLFYDNFGAWNNSSDQTLTRTYPGGENTGVASIGFWVKSWSPDNGSGARLTYRGDYVIID